MKEAIEKINKPAILFALLLIGAGISSCDNDDPKPPVLPDSSVTVNISHTWKGVNLELGAKYFVTDNEDSIQPTKLIYHINNFIFITEKGEEVKPGTQYFMVNGSENLVPSLNMGTLEDKTFTKVRFTLGIADSITNADGLLNSIFIDPMYWSMAAGYINFKLEGKSPNILTNNVLTLHLGGYQSPYENNYTFEFELGNYKLKSEIGLNHLNLQMDIAELFRDPNLIDVSVINDVQMPNDQAKMLAENFGSMITFNSTN